MDQKKALESGRKIKDIAHDLGVDAAMVTAYKNGVRPLSGVVKAMFYYYFTLTEISNVEEPDGNDALFLIREIVFAK